ncbi:MAG: HD family phosphohydrolase [Thermoanaerobaculia bacterium]
MRRGSWRERTVLWMVLYVIVTSLCFGPAISFRAVRLRSGAIAQRDVIAAQDYILPDPESTDRKRLEAAAAVRPVYDFDTQAAARLEDRLEKSFANAREAGRLPPSGKRRATMEVARDGFTMPIGDEAFQALARQKFSSEIEARLVASAARLYRAGIVDNKELLLQHRERGVTLRDSATGTERVTVDLFSTAEYGSDVKSLLAAELAGGKMTSSEIREVSAFLASALTPNLTFNAAETARRRDLASRQVESVLVKVPRGQVIVRRGDLVTPRDARIIAAVQGSASEPEPWWRLFGVVCVQILAAFAFWIDSEIRSRTMRKEPSTLLPLLAVGIVFALVLRGGFSVAQILSANISSDALASDSLALPFAAGPIVAVLVAGAGPGPAVLFAGIQAIGAGILLGSNFQFALFALAGSLAGIYGMKRLGSRSVLFGMGGIVAGTNLLVVSIWHALSGNAGSLLPDLASAAAGGLLVAALVAFLLPLFETLFHVTTDIRLLELSNLNLPVLRTLAFEAPGTYQHSLMVGHLAEAAAEAIGANPLLARVCAYYHDIGKTKMPEYFIENQPRGFNRHDRLEPSMSALIIASHVKEGVELARKSRLPEPIVTGIREHHGTKLIRYFYQKALSRADASSPPILESDYRYPGPKPSNRITGILMLADAVEAASRTLVEPTPAKISAMVRAIGSDGLRDGQFDSCDLTMGDLTSIQESLIRTVTTMFHHRIDYPGFDFNAREKTEAPPRRGSGTIRLNAK